MNTFSRTKPHIRATFQKSWKITLILILFFESIHQVVYSCAKIEGQEWVAPLVDFLVSMIESYALVLFIPVLVKSAVEQREIPVMEHVQKNFNQLAIESLRALGRITIGYCLLIVPGIIRSIRLYFLPYFVQFDETYHEGKIDALQGSEKLVKGRTWGVLWLLILVGIISFLPAWLKSTTEVFTLKWAVSLGLTLVAEIYTQLLLYDIYIDLTKSTQLKETSWV